jgi:DNA topoisomerase-1
VQLGDSDDEDKRFASLPPHTSIETITLEQALKAFQLPRELGDYEGKKIQTNIGRFGPYVSWNKLFVSLKPSEENPDDTVFGLTYERALELIQEKQEKEANRYIHQREHEGRDISVENGRYGPFIRIRQGKKRPVNIKLPPEIKKDEKKLKALTLEEVLEMVK